ncbi:hypothetical protein J1N35_041363 [Gossypium stocksii]|uniref:Uncharacterized protein n=1 Tax=Gossypium stocksii TaxID=47602 RepID=A0A9D3UFQ6_9ROSI|nr:hypothetical protein J1N35_041363 [Gossypium stocksii]
MAEHGVTTSLQKDITILQQKFQKMQGEFLQLDVQIDTRTTKGSSKGISLVLMNERKQKGFCFWCSAKYHIGHKCVKGKLYQVLIDTQSDGDGEEF